MKTIENTYISPEKYFTVTKKDTNNNNALLTNVLYNEMESFVKNIIITHKDTVVPIPKLYKLQVLKNAFLNDKLLLKSQIIKYNTSELHLLTKVMLHSNTDDTICKAVFKFPLITPNVMAS